MYISLFINAGLKVVVICLRTNEANRRENMKRKTAGIAARWACPWRLCCSFYLWLFLDLLVFTADQIWPLACALSKSRPLGVEVVVYKSAMSR